MQSIYWKKLRSKPLKLRGLMERVHICIQVSPLLSVAVLTQESVVLCARVKHRRLTLVLLGFAKVRCYTLRTWLLLSIQALCASVGRKYREAGRQWSKVDKKPAHLMERRRKPTYRTSTLYTSMKMMYLGRVGLYTDAVTFPNKGLEFLSWVVGTNCIMYK